MRIENIENQNKYIEFFINNLYNRYVKIRELSKINTFFVFYEDISDKKLASIFSYIHGSLNNLFSFMNQKINVNRHFNADTSRDLITLIDDIGTLLKSLEKVNMKYIIHNDYKNVIDECKKFLESSGGSSIPEDFKPIEIIEIEPIFTSATTVKVSNYNFETKHIGSGSYAEVLKYKDTFYNKFFVIKKAKSDLNEKELIRFKREFDTMKKLNSPYILEVYNYNEDDNSYIMEYADFTIGKYIDKNNSKLQISQRTGMVYQIFKAFDYLHSEEILHRDVSVSNVLLKQYDNNLLVVKVADFGLVKLKDSVLTDEHSEFKGSLNDPNLEVQGGFKNFSIEHETYALTRLIFYIMTGRRTIEDFRPYSDNFKNFILKGINQNTTLRYKSIKEMRVMFNNIKF